MALYREVISLDSNFQTGTKILFIIFGTYIFESNKNAMT